MAKKRNRSQRTSRRTRNGAHAALHQEFNPDYSYVVQDLRRIALLAGSFVVILVALTFVLR